MFNFPKEIQLLKDSSIGVKAVLGAEFVLPGLTFRD